MHDSQDLSSCARNANITLRIKSAPLANSKNSGANGVPPVGGKYGGVISGVGEDGGVGDDGGGGVGDDDGGVGDISGTFGGVGVGDDVGGVVGVGSCVGVAVGSGVGVKPYAELAWTVADRPIPVKTSARRTAKNMLNTNLL